MTTAIRLAWQMNRRRAVWCIGLAVLACSSMALSAQQVTQQTPEGWSMSDILTPQNVLSLCVLVYHFGILRQEMRDIQSRLKSIESWRETGAAASFARKDVLEAKLDAIDERLVSIEAKL